MDRWRRQDQPEFDRATNELRTVAEKGRKALEAAYKALPKAIRDELKESGVMATIGASADEYDRQRLDRAPGGAAIADLNAELDDAS